LALWFASPETTYRLTCHFDEHYIAKGFGYTRNELTRRLKEHGITDFFVAFEVYRSDSEEKRRRKWRLHCHAMARIPGSTNIEALKQSLSNRFLKNRQARKELTAFGNKIADIDRVIYSPLEHKAPEYWATYALKNADTITEAVLGWDSAHYISRSLVEPAKAIYKWLRNPVIDNIPFAVAPQIPAPQQFCCRVYQCSGDLQQSADSGTSEKEGTLGPIDDLS
jgi:hypothetical protein